MTICLLPATVVLLAQPVAPISPEESIRATVEAWNQAHAAKDADAMLHLYANEVGFYGTTMSKNDCLSIKRKFFYDNPSFFQSIDGNIEVTKNEQSGGYTARFIKRVFMNGWKQLFPSYLIIDALEREDNQQEKDWKIIIESDMVTDANLLRQKRSFDIKKLRSCKDAVTAIFKSAETINKLITSSIIVEIDNSNGRDVYGLHLFYLPPLGGMTMTMGWYKFNVKTGTLTDSVLDVTLHYDKRLLPYVDKFCR